MKPRLYLETTIPSYLGARPSKNPRLAADQQATKEWWEKRRHDYELFISDVVLFEVRRGDVGMAAVRLAALAGIPGLWNLPVAAQLTNQLLAGGILPPKAGVDAAHLGLAAAHGMDYLLTWNCKHINNPALRPQIELACGECGLTCPLIYTPAELMKIQL